MKIIRKDDEFKKMPFQNIEDSNTIDGFIRHGWKFCSKKEYKDFYKVEQTTTEKKKEDKENKKKK